MAFKSTGKIKEIKDGVVIADGLSDVAYNELVEIQDSEGKIHLGLALNLDAESVGIIVLGEYSSIGEDDMVTATGKQLAIEVSNSLLSNVIDPLGRSLEDVKIVHTKDVRSEPLEQVAAGVSERKDVSRPLPTGIKSIDAMIPIGKGQRELIIGDRQTGKSAIAIDTIINQKGKNVKCIYVGIGQKMAKISALKARLLMEGAMDYTVIVAASTSQAASLQYIAPFTGVAIGEYFAKRGEDALVIFDDLTKHAWAYREISLLLKRPPGREALKEHYNIQMKTKEDR
ncbi:MAG: ATP synthase subunit alpha [candidate division WS6 bacterium GW2011_GWA2_37_6]|uniref:ATP synthase subunit alpha n=1 Tax=candidate division WS6 bacterium GW2011_GWA2_37_6 TaxID=1619087 RepID=A0A0G0GX92_9BACT|nr:MAG: ATP synthase subunit alpha [candidate division WS6 bacterium GW2011_GWA2_37_6]